jgi:rRNA maturation RNase YbeY
MAIRFDYHETRFKLPHPKKTIAWIESVIRAEKSRIDDLSYVFCTDRYLVKINQSFLDHDTLTDIITFDYSETPWTSEAEIYISVQRVRENASKLGVDFDSELHRVIIHGVLHLIGYKDKTDRDRHEMRRREEKYLDARNKK